jgi:hypothetical protein
MRLHYVDEVAQRTNTLDLYGMYWLALLGVCEIVVRLFACLRRRRRTPVPP